MKTFILIIILMSMTFNAATIDVLGQDGIYWGTLSDLEKANLVTGMIMGSYAILLWLNGHGFEEAVSTFPLNGKLNSGQIRNDIDNWYKTGKIDTPIMVVFFITNEERYGKAINNQKRSEDYPKKSL